MAAFVPPNPFDRLGSVPKDAPPDDRSLQDGEAARRLRTGQTNKVSAWLRRIFGHGHKNPEDYERVRCDRCNGTGLILDLPGNVKANQYRAPAPKCGRCHGKGFVLVRRAQD